jgi:ferredoxin
MIKATPKPLEEIIEFVKDYNKILVAGCDGCVTVCEAGGMKEAKVLGAALRLYYTQAGKDHEVVETTVTRQCDKEYLEELKEMVENADAVVSIACGCGIQYLGEMYNKKVVFPGVDTHFMGINAERGVFEERCAGCGQCVLATTGGICPIARCSKRMLNGPCGGSEAGKCEISKDTPCGWHLIYERLETLGQLNRFVEPVDPKNWRTSRDGGPRVIIREDLRKGEPQHGGAH